MVHITEVEGLDNLKAMVALSVPTWYSTVQVYILPNSHMLGKSSELQAIQLKGWNLGLAFLP